MFRSTETMARCISEHETLRNKPKQLCSVCVALTDVLSRTSDVSSTCEVAFWQIVASTNDETSSATYGSGAAHATGDVINERGSSRNKDPASRKCASEMRLLVCMTVRNGCFDFYRRESTDLLTDD